MSEDAPMHVTLKASVTKRQIKFVAYGTQVHLEQSPVFAIVRGTTALSAKSS